MPVYFSRRAVSSTGARSRGRSYKHGRELNSALAYKHEVDEQR